MNILDFVCVPFGGPSPELVIPFFRSLATGLDKLTHYFGVGTIFGLYFRRLSLIYQWCLVSELIQPGAISMKLCNGTTRIKSNSTIPIESNGTINIESNSTITIESNGTISIKVIAL